MAFLEKKIETQQFLCDSLKKYSKEVTIDKYENYLKYKYSLIKSTGVWNTAERFFTYSRRSLFVARLFKYGALIVAFIETSAVFLIFATALLFIIPATLLFALILMLTDIIAGRKYNEKILGQIKDKKILFLIARKGYRKNRNSYFDKMACDFANNGHYCVIVISKSLRDGIFLTARFESKNLIIIRESYFFRLKRAIKTAKFDAGRVIIVH